jgi:hypothetical protein
VNVEIDFDPVLVIALALAHPHFVFDGDRSGKFNRGFRRFHRRSEQAMDQKLSTQHGGQQSATPIRSPQSAILSLATCHSSLHRYHSLFLFTNHHLCARVVEWQTRTFEGRMPKGMRVQVPPRALFSNQRFATANPSVGGSKVRDQRSELRDDRPQ